VQRLHPTPALGGAPSEQALAFLRHVEPVPRGWYAGPVGWLDSELDGVFAVAIRSAVTQYNRAWLYAGAGIVGESLPEREWAETALKFRPMLGALGAEELP
jgi:menaquinone-specific isochorismate synthase